VGCGAALIGLVGVGRFASSEVGRERLKNGRQSRHVRQSVCRACCLSQGYGNDDASDWVRSGREIDRWSKSKCLLGRHLEPICDSLEPWAL